MCKSNESKKGQCNGNGEGSSRATNTLNAQRPRSINLSDIKSTSDLEALKAQDPWMYYSIPAVRNSVTLGRAVDISTITAAVSSGASSVVERRSRISYENSDTDMLEASIAELMVGGGTIDHSNDEVIGNSLFDEFLESFFG